MILELIKRYCVRHIYGNLKRRYPGKEIKDAYWPDAKATIMQAFMEKLGKIGKVSENVVGYLVELGIEHQSRHAWSPRPKTKLLLNNPSECFNNFVSGKNRKKNQF